MKNKLLLSFTLAAFALLPLTAQQETPSNTPNPQNSTSSSQNTPDNNSATTQSNENPGATNQNTNNQTPADQNTTSGEQPSAQVPTYRVTVVQRTTQAVDYRDRGGTTQLDIKGTSLEPQVTGTARVTGHTGRLAIDASVHHLSPARSFGPEYLTYVLWAITPEGRPVNLGELKANDDRDSRVQVTSPLQEFGMIVTAEPYFAVTRPSNLVVAENIVRPETTGGIHPISAKFDLLQKGQYTVNINADQLPATTADRRTPVELLEAENAIAIAEAAGANQYAADTLGKAKAYLAQGQDYYRRKQGITPIGAVARAATQAAEDARLLTLQKKQEEQAAAERQRAQDRIQQAQSQAESEAARAEAARQEAQRQQEQRELAEQERQAAEQARLQAEQAAQQASQERAAAEQQLQQAEQARQQALQQQQAASQQAEQARLQAQQAEQARQQAVQQAEQQRQRLLTQLNQVLQTKDTARGLIVNMSDVLFDFNKATLKPGAQLRLARVAGIILAYPDLKLEVDGFTDNKGTPQYNQVLSEKRAATVRDFLVSQGVSPDAVITRGYGESNPVASNTTAAGRQQNRRVELVVSGTAIGTNIGPASGTAGTTAAGAPGSTGSVSGSSSSTTTGGVSGSATGNVSGSSPAATGGVTGATQSTTAPAQPSGTTPGISSPAGSTSPSGTTNPAGTTTQSPSSTTAPGSTTQPPTGTPPAQNNPPKH